MHAFICLIPLKYMALLKNVYNGCKVLINLIVLKYLSINRYEYAKKTVNFGCPDYKQILPYKYGKMIQLFNMPRKISTVTFYQLQTTI